MNQFEPTNSFCYRFARYDALPEIEAQPEVVSGQPFRLITVANRVINARLTASQLNATFIRSQSGQPAKIGHTIKFYIQFLARKLGVFKWIGDGMYRLATGEADIDDLLEEAAEEEDALAENSEDEDASSGSIYAYTFPLIKKPNGPFPIKIGKTTGAVQDRVNWQTQKTGSFEKAQILKTWSVKRLSSTEYAIHNILKARNKWRGDAPGTEWFDTTVSEVDEIIAFIGSAS